MKLSREEVLHIATLARVGMTDADVEKLREQLSNILENFEILKELDTTNVPPTAQSIDLRNVERPDKQAPSCTQEEVLANTPYPESGHFRVKAVLE